MILGGVGTELVVLGGIGGQLSWARPILLVAGLGGVGVICLRPSRPGLRRAAVAVALAGLLVSPAAWALDTLGHASNGTFPAGGPARARRSAGGGAAGRRTAVPVPGSTPAGFAGPGGDTRVIAQAVSYAKAHGAGTVAVASQSSASSAILSLRADVAGLGGFSGRESSVSISWLAQAVREGRLRWLVQQSGPQRRLPGDNRAGSSTAMAAASRACRHIGLGSSAVLLDCRGAGAAIQRAATT